MGLQAALSSLWALTIQAYDQTSEHFFFFFFNSTIWLHFIPISGCLEQFFYPVFSLFFHQPFIV